MQAEYKTSNLRCGVTPIRASMQVCSRTAQTSAALIQLFSSNGTMLPMLTLTPLTSRQRMERKYGGYVISAQMAICTAGRQRFSTGAMAVVALSAAAARSVSKTPWPPRLPQSQLSGATKQMLVPQKAWWHTAVSVLVGYVRCVATTGVQHPTRESAKAGCPKCRNHTKAKQTRQLTFADCQDP